eukprot:12068364-Alexandrium_andersonii.AAC.1
MGGETALVPVLSVASVPQGDPAAMAAMGLLMLFPTIRIRHLLGDPLLSVFADDRNAISTTQAGMDTIQQ